MIHKGRMFEHARVERLISRIRNAHSTMDKIFTQGSCWDFYLILKEVYPEAIAYYNATEGHIHTKIDGRYYDIRGELDDRGKGYLVRLPHPDYRPWEWDGRVESFECLAMYFKGVK